MTEDCYILVVLFFIGRDVVVNDLLLLRFEIFFGRFEKAFEIRNQIKVEWEFEVMRLELQFRLFPLRVFALLGRMCKTHLRLWSSSTRCDMNACKQDKQTCLPHYLVYFE